MILKYLKYIVFKTILNLFGIRFFKTEIVPTNAEFRKAEFKTFGSHSIEFLFYRETLDDLIFKRNKIHKEKLHCYIVQSRFDNHFPEDITKFNNLKFVFNLNKLRFIDEETICDVLLNIYVDFIKLELKNNEKK